ncbi:MAG TPA: outer membrane beta-barrel protein [Bacteroidales bacterium]|nr:outer membrane beta-barrel protein [Bacteroidales bacterium]
MKVSVKIMITGILLIVLANTTVSAQDRKFNFGIHFSPNISWIKPDVDGGELYKYESDGARLLMGYGADFNYFFIPNIALGTGVNVVYNGGKLKYPSPYVVKDANNVAQDTVDCNLYRKYKLQYLEIPLVMIGSTGDLMGNFSIYGKFGLGTSFKLKARSDDEYVKKSAQDISYKDENKNIGKDVNFIKESLIIGIGGTYKFKKVISLNFGINYNSGFTDILTSENPAEITPKIKENGKASYVEMYVGVLF